MMSEASYLVMFVFIRFRVASALISEPCPYTWEMNQKLIVECVHIRDSGELVPNVCRVNDGQPCLDDKKLNVLHVSNGIAFLSSRSVKDLAEGHYFNFELPPPLSMYLFPSPLFALGYRDEVFTALTCEEFANICRQCGQAIREVSNDVVVYDVPLNLDSDDEPDEVEYVDSGAELDDEEEDHTWEEDEDILASAEVPNEIVK